jgi:hypothetical protein
MHGPDRRRSNNEAATLGRQVIPLRPYQRRAWLSFRRTIWHDDALPGPTLGLEGIMLGRDMFHAIRRTLELGFDLAGPDGLIGFDLSAIRTIDRLHVAHLALAARSRSAARGRGRYVLPNAPWGHWLSEMVGGWARQVAVLPETITVDFGPHNPISEETRP